MSSVASSLLVYTSSMLENIHISKIFIFHWESQSYVEHSYLLQRMKFQRASANLAFPAVLACWTRKTLVFWALLKPEAAHAHWSCILCTTKNGTKPSTRLRIAYENWRNLGMLMQMHHRHHWHWFSIQLLQALALHPPRKHMLWPLCSLEGERQHPQSDPRNLNEG